MFSIIGIVLAVSYSLFILPHFLLNKTSFSVYRVQPTKGVGCVSPANNVSIVIWAFLTVLFFFLSFGIKFDSNIKKMDGTSKEILHEEEQFRNTWGFKQQAILVTTNASYEKALKQSDVSYKEITEALGPGNIFSISMLWPSQAARKENATRWRQFWREGRAEKLKKWLKQEGAQYQFSKDAFSPFFDNLYKNTIIDDKPNENKFLDRLIKRFVQKRQNEYQVLTFFPDEKENIESILKLIRGNPESFLVSQIALAGFISEGVSWNIKRITPIAVVLVILLIYFCLGNIKESLIALVPVVTSIVWVLGLMVVFGLTLNVASVIACIILLGICVDYGVFIVYKHRDGYNTGTNTAVALAAATTICGSGSLIFAKHPALFSVGITMVIGVMSGYLSSVFVVPRLSTLFLASGKKS